MKPPDDFTWQSLTGPLSPFALRRDRAAIMDPEIGVFGALADPDDPAAWDDLGELVGPGGGIGLFPGLGAYPDGWSEVFRLAGVQMIASEIAGDRRTDVVDLCADDAAEVIDLVDRTRPGPFARRTIELGGYVGLRDDDRLLAVAGRRLATDQFVEISAVCVDPGHRRQGLARVVVDAVVAGIRAEGRIPMLHAAADNTGAIALYEAMGFVVTKRFDFVAVQAPGDPDPTGDQT